MLIFSSNKTKKWQFLLPPMHLCQSFHFFVGSLGCLRIVFSFSLRHASLLGHDVHLLRYMCKKGFGADRTIWPGLIVSGGAENCQGRPCVDCHPRRSLRAASLRKLQKFQMNCSWLSVFLLILNSSVNGLPSQRVEADSRHTWPTQGPLAGPLVWHLNWPCLSAVFAVHVLFFKDFAHKFQSLTHITWSLRKKTFPQTQVNFASSTKRIAAMLQYAMCRPMSGNFSLNMMHVQSCHNTWQHETNLPVHICVFVDVISKPKTLKHCRDKRAKIQRVKQNLWDMTRREKKSVSSKCHDDMRGGRSPMFSTCAQHENLFFYFVRRQLNMIGNTMGGTWWIKQKSCAEIFAIPIEETPLGVFLGWPPSRNTPGRFW